MRRTCASVWPKKPPGSKPKHGVVPGLATVLVGADPASEVYVRNKNKMAEALGFKSVHLICPPTPAKPTSWRGSARSTADKSVHGILVQLPLPKQIREQAVLDALDPAKDVDALTPTNAGLLLSGRAKLVSCTADGRDDPAQGNPGRHRRPGDVLVIGRSLLFGKPAAQLCWPPMPRLPWRHSKTRDLPAQARRRRHPGRRNRQAGICERRLGQTGATVIDVGHQSRGRGDR